MDTMNGVDNDNISLREFSCNMEKELITISSIHKNNLQEFRTVTDTIRNLYSCEMSYPVKIGHCTQIREKYLEHESKSLEKFENFNSEYNLLLEQETKLENGLNNVRKRLKQGASELEKCEEEHQSAKKRYKSYKTALNVAKKAYDTNFGLEVNIKDQEHSPVFTADVIFKGKNEDLIVRFFINRALKNVVDFEATWLEPIKFEELKTEFRQIGNVLSLMSTLRSLALVQER